MNRVIIESPWRPTPYHSQAQHALYLNFCIEDSLTKGEAPFASHLLYTPFLDDDDVLARGKGIKAGYVWGELADLVAVYSDLGVSAGMKQALDHYAFENKIIEWRTLAAPIVASIAKMAD